MTVKDYMLKAEEIAKREFMCRTDMLCEIGIAWNTWIRLQKDSESCSAKTVRKIKKFVDKWESKVK